MQRARKLAFRQLEFVYGIKEEPCRRLAVCYPVVESSFFISGENLSKCHGIEHFEGKKESEGIPANNSSRLLLQLARLARSGVGQKDDPRVLE